MNFHFTVDETHTNNANEYYRDAKRLQISSGVFSLVLLLAAVLMLVFLNHTPWIIGGAIVVLAIAVLYIGVTFQIKRQIKEPQELYDSSPLVPAMIAEVNERTMTLMALVDTRKNPSQGLPQRALTIRTVTAVSGAPRRVGAPVPAVAVGGAHKTRADYYDEVTPVPLSWSTRDASVIRKAEQAITGVEWNLLKANLDRVEEVRSTKRDLLIIS